MLMGALFLFFGIGIVWVMENPISLLIILPILIHLYKVVKIIKPKAYDPLLKELTMSTFFISLALFVIFYLYK